MGRWGVVSHQEEQVLYKRKGRAVRGQCCGSGEEGVSWVG